MAYAEPVVAVSRSNVNVSNPGTAVFDGITVGSGNRILLTAQSTASQNGVWIFNGPTFALGRPSANGDQYANANPLDNSTLVPVTNGNTYAGTVWGIDPSKVITVDTTGHTLTRVSLQPVQARAATTTSISLASTWSSIDGVSVVGNGAAGSDIVLLKDQSTPSQNGLYWANTSGAMARCTEPLVPGRNVIVLEGDRNAHSRHELVTSAPIIPGTTSLEFAPQHLIFNVRDFGAKGDCTDDDPTTGTDDLPAFRAALEAMSVYRTDQARAARLEIPALPTGRSYRLGTNGASVAEWSIEVPAQILGHGSGVAGAGSKITLANGTSIVFEHQSSSPHGGDASDALMSALEILCHAPTSRTLWQPSQAVSIGDRRYFSQNARFWVECIKAGTTQSVPIDSTWSAAAPIQYTDRRRRTSGNTDKVFVAVGLDHVGTRHASNSEPTWDTTIGNITTETGPDGDISWCCYAAEPHPNLNIDRSEAWTAGNVGGKSRYGAVVRATNRYDVFFERTDTTDYFTNPFFRHANSEPAWDYTPGHTTTETGADGNITWTCRSATGYLWTDGTAVWSRGSTQACGCERARTCRTSRFRMRTSASRSWRAMPSRSATPTLSV